MPVFLSARAWRCLRRVIVCAALMLTPLAVCAQGPPKSVLYVYSGERNVAGSSSETQETGRILFDVTLERLLRTGLDGNLYHYSEFVDSTRIGDPSHAQDVLNLLIGMNRNAWPRLST